VLNPAVFPLCGQKIKADVCEYGYEEELCRQKEEIFLNNCHEDNREKLYMKLSAIDAGKSLYSGREYRYWVKAITINPVKMCRTNRQGNKYTGSW
jgi:hypothetical protein